MRRVTSMHSLRGGAHFGATSPSSSPSPAPAVPNAWRQIGIGVAVVLISGALIGIATRLFARPRVSA